MRKLMLAALVAAMAAATPAVAADSAAEAEIAAIEAMPKDIYRLDYKTQKDLMRDRYMAMHDRAKAAAGRFAGDPAAVTRLRTLQGSAIFNVAQHNDPDWADIEGQKAEIAWLVETIEVLAPVLAAGNTPDGPHYEFRGAAGQLFDHGLRFGDPRFESWSAARVLANRYRVEADPDDWFEKRLLAEALYDHGWLTKNEALTAEAETLFAAIPEDERGYNLREKHEAVAAGAPPYRQSN